MHAAPLAPSPDAALAPAPTSTEVAPRAEPTELAPRPVPAKPVDLELLLAFEQRRKSPGLAFSLAAGFGLFGGHRFYMKKPFAAVMLGITLASFLLTFVFIGLLGVAAMYVWVLTDLFQVGGWVREHNQGLLRELSAG